MSRWPVWRLPPAVLTLVLTVVGAYLAIALWGSLTTELDSRSVIGTAIFGGAAILSVEVSMRFAWPRTRKARASRDFLGVWMLPVALLLPPNYVAVMVLAPLSYMQVRVWRRDPVKFSYSVAVLGLSYAGASFVVRLIASAEHDSQWNLGNGSQARDAIAVAAAVVTWWVINHGLIAAVVARTAGKEAVVQLLKDREGYLLDIVDACAGVVATVLWLASPFAVLLLLPPALLMQHQLFSGLRQAVRTDLLTEVANPQYWRETAAREIDRAWASGANLSLLMIDIDHFKEVNDRYGHLAGDEVLAAVARTISKALRPGDLVGRLGGEEFGAVLSGLNLLDAEGAAERLRAQVAELLVGSEHGDWIHVTVSVGVAELSVTGGDLRRLLDAADTALYAAKQAGRNRVRIAGPRRGQVIDLRKGADRSRSLDPGRAAAPEPRPLHTDDALRAPSAASIDLDGAAAPSAPAFNPTNL